MPICNVSEPKIDVTYENELQQNQNMASKQEQEQKHEQNLQQKMCLSNPNPPNSQAETKIRSIGKSREIIIGSQRNFKRILIDDNFCKIKLEKKHFVVSKIVYLQIVLC